MKIIKLLIFTAFLIQSLLAQDKPRVAISMDDPNTNDTPLMTWQERNESILNTLKKHNLQAALFICGKRIDNDSGKVLLKSWNDAGHLLCNHSYSHIYFHSDKVTLDDYVKDFLKCDSLLNGYSMFYKIFRYPYLKEGNTIEKRDGFRNILTAYSYRTGHVTIDASDWYIDSRLIDSLKKNPNLDNTPYKEYYLQHIYDRAQFYNDLALKVTGRQITHTLLIHHSFLNALFLDDLINMFIDKGWEVVPVGRAYYMDPIYDERPDILPAGESLIWALAKQTGQYNNILRYPGEDGSCEEEGFNKFITEYSNSKSNIY